jgi:hypothetical protein
MKTYKNHLNEEIKRPKYPKGKWVKVGKNTATATMEDYYFELVRDTDLIVVAIADLNEIRYKTLMDWELDFIGNKIVETGDDVIAFMVLKPYK